MREDRLTRLLHAELARCPLERTSSWQSTSTVVATRNGRRRRGRDRRFPEIDAVQPDRAGKLHLTLVGRDQVGAPRASDRGWHGEVVDAGTRAAGSCPLARARPVAQASVHRRGVVARRDARQRARQQGFADALGCGTLRSETGTRARRATRNGNNGTGRNRDVAEDTPERRGDGRRWRRVGSATSEPCESCTTTRGWRSA